MNIPYSNDVSIIISERFLKAEHLRISHKIDRYDLDFWVDRPYAMDELVANISYRVWTEDLPPKILRGPQEYKFPDGPLSAFINKYFPAWLKQYFPVKYTTIVVPEVEFPGFKVLYPDFHPAVPKNQSVTIVRNVSNWNLT